MSGCAALFKLRDFLHQTQGSLPVLFKPNDNKRCFLNGVFQSSAFRGWPGSATAEGLKMPENTVVFGHSVPL